MKNQNITNTLTTALLALGFFGLCPTPKAFGVVPPPDGGYANFTTAEGQNALFSLTSGAANTAVGWFSLKSVTTGSFNTSVGAGTLVLNTGDANTATGTAALLLNVTGQRNTANGTAALVNNSTGEDNTAVGAFALNSNTATGNTAIGSQALLNNTTGGTVGNIQGTDVGPNVAVGWQALESNTVASANTAVGYQALQSFTTGPVGFEQFGLCTAVGFQALANATGDGFGNSGFGYQALFSTTTGGHNTAVGDFALYNNTGFGNTAIGDTAGYSLTTGFGNVCIGASVQGTAGATSTTWIQNVYASLANGRAVYVNADNKIGTLSSSRRYKDEIRPMAKASEAILSLRPVSFRYKKDVDPTRLLSFGLIAEEVAEVDPDLVTPDRDGKPETVRYEAVNAMLLNEFLKAHRKMEKLEATVARQQQGMEALASQVKEQAGQIQKVSAEIELNKSVARVAEAGQ
jgi:uncharacterized coiled-coil protein SlyX